VPACSVTWQATIDIQQCIRTSVATTYLLLKTQLRCDFMSPHDGTLPLLLSTLTQHNKCGALSPATSLANTHLCSGLLNTAAGYMKVSCFMTIIHYKLICKSHFLTTFLDVKHRTTLRVMRKKLPNSYEKLKSNDELTKYGRWQWAHVIRIPSEFGTPELTSAPGTRSRMTLLLQNKQKTLSISTKYKE